LYFVEIASQSGEPAGFTLSWTWSQAGANDNFANAQAISGVYGSINGTTVNASVEPGDPAAGTGTDQTVWYSYVAPTTGVQISLYDESQAQNVYFYTGTTLANLVNITSTVNPNTGVLPTTPGATYYVEVASQGNNPGTFGLLWQAVPANDNFANAQGITGTYGSVNGSDSPATTEAGEPGVSNYAQSVWYSYTAPNGAPGYLFFNLSNQFGNVINIYTGNSLSNLQLVGSNTYGVAFNATAGTTYQIQILSNSELDSFTLNWLFEPAPANDNFANAQAISGYNGTAAGSLSAATIESGEPSVTTGSASIWYEYTAPADCAGQVSFTETDMDGGVDIYVYSGSSLTNLTRLTSQDLEHPAVLATTPGATYYVQIFSAGSDQFISTSLAWSWISNNDNFASATALPSANGSMTGTTFGATVQSGEPNSSSTNQSVWYAYTAPSPSAGTATFSLTGNSTAQNVDVYTGSALGSLTLVGSGSNGATMSTTPGTTYYIQVESPADNPASFTFNWSWTASGGTSSFNRSSSANLNALPVARKSSAHSS